jgi:hypothetical protein
VIFVLTKKAHQNKQKYKTEALKTFLLILFTLSTIAGKAQKIEKIFVNLYTDSLKKGTHNYINIDGQLSNGRYLPLDSTKILFACAQAKFSGNSIIIPANFTEEKVTIKTTLKSDPAIFKEFDVYIKKMEDPPLKSTNEVMAEMKTGKKKKKK